MTPSYTYTLKDAGFGSSGQVLSAGSGGSNGTYSINATSPTWTNTSTAAVIDAAGTMELRGKNADLIINGESLKDTLNEIKMALRIPNKLTRDPILEEEFDELKRAAEHYEKLKEKYLEQQKVWDTLKNKNLK